jgi:hypothetical protein
MPTPMPDNDAVSTWAANYNGPLGGITYDPGYGKWDFNNSLYASYP